MQIWHMFRDWWYMFRVAMQMLYMFRVAHAHVHVYVLMCMHMHGHVGLGTPGLELANLDGDCTTRQFVLACGRSLSINLASRGRKSGVGGSGVSH